MLGAPPLRFPCGRMLLVVSRKKRRPTARVVPAHVDAAHLATARHLATIQDHVRVSGLTHTAEEPVERCC